MFGSDNSEQVRASSIFNRDDRSLAGFVLSGRWPDNTHEWAQLLTLAVRLAATPGGLPTTRIFRAVEELPEDPRPDTVGLVVCVGSVTGDGALQPGSFSACLPRALMVLHPPGETSPSIPEADGAASGCVLLPGIPEIGMNHRASWVEAHANGRITKLLSSIAPDARLDPDLAILSMLCAA
jgi:hypothetical protein